MSEITKMLLICAALLLVGSICGAFLLGQVYHFAQFQGWLK